MNARDPHRKIQTEPRSAWFGGVKLVGCADQFARVHALSLILHRDFD
jgi:hypothetical protein